MRLKIKLGYFISLLIIAIGIISSIGKLDKNFIVLYFGLFLFSCVGIFYSIKDRKNKTSFQDWLTLGGFTLILVGVFIHFIYKIDVRILLLALCALLYPQIGFSKTYSKS
jgi:uncharacterized membrane protein HdeD (DUF308 family)